MHGLQTVGSVVGFSLLCSGDLLMLWTVLLVTPVPLRPFVWGVAFAFTHAVAASVGMVFGECFHHFSTIGEVLSWILSLFCVLYLVRKLRQASRGEESKKLDYGLVWGVALTNAWDALFGGAGLSGVTGNPSIGVNLAASSALGLLIGLYTAIAVQMIRYTRSRRGAGLGRYLFWRFFPGVWQTVVLLVQYAAFSRSKP